MRGFQRMTGLVFFKFLQFAVLLVFIAFISDFRRKKRHGRSYLANKETETLLEKYGAPFQRYKEKVHAFLPLKKYYEHN
jgi:protein-S-isoprenylcysteine O-methyltransferase Ste14